MGKLLSFRLVALVLTTKGPLSEMPFSPQKPARGNVQKTPTRSGPLHAADPLNLEKRRRWSSALLSEGARAQQPPVATVETESGYTQGLRGEALTGHRFRARPRCLSRFASQRGPCLPGAQWCKPSSGGRRRRLPQRMWTLAQPACPDRMALGCRNSDGRNPTRQKGAPGSCSTSDGTGKASRKAGNGLQTPFLLEGLDTSAAYLYKETLGRTPVRLGGCISLVNALHLPALERVPRFVDLASTAPRLGPPACCSTCLSCNRLSMVSTGIDIGNVEKLRTMSWSFCAGGIQVKTEM